MRLRSILAAFALTAASTLPAAAQDYDPGAWAIDLSQNLMMNEMLSNAHPTTPSQRQSFAQALTRPVPVARTLSDFDSRYRSDPAVTRRVVAEYLSWVRSTAGEQAMREVQQDLTRYNFVRLWGDLVRSEGLATGDMADAFAGYLLLNWAMANNRIRDDFAAAVPGVRSQIRSAMAASPAFSSLSNADRQGLAETLMINFIIQHAWIQQAARTGDAALERRVGDAAQQRFANEFGMNLRAMQLTRQGFIARR
jgi:hypothetical protein